jgi:hypothetical protein
LAFATLRDSRLIRQTQQEGIATAEMEFEKELADFSTDKNIDLFKEFLNLKAENKPMPVQAKMEEEIKPVLVIDEELNELRNGKIGIGIKVSR